MHQRLLEAYLSLRRSCPSSRVAAGPMLRGQTLVTATVNALRGTYHYDQHARVGAADGDGRRWVVHPNDVGLHFIGWADELRGGRHHDGCGYYTDRDGGNDRLIRGCVYALKGSRGGRTVYFAAYRQGGERRRSQRGAVYANPEWQDDCGEESAHIDLRTSYLSEPGGREHPKSGWGEDKDSDSCTDAARDGDRMADSAAETEREYNEASDDGYMCRSVERDARDAFETLLADIDSCTCVEDYIDGVLDEIERFWEQVDDYTNNWSGGPNEDSFNDGRMNY